MLCLFTVLSCRFRTTVFPNGTLHIASVRKSDEATYICQGTGPDGVLQSFTAELLLSSKLYVFAVVE